MSESRRLRAIALGAPLATALALQVLLPAPADAGRYAPCTKAAIQTATGGQVLTKRCGGGYAAGSVLKRGEETPYMVKSKTGEGGGEYWVKVSRKRMNALCREDSPVPKRVLRFSACNVS